MKSELLGCWLAVAMVGWSACRTPQRDLVKAQDRRDHAKAGVEQAQVEQLEKGRDFTYAADHALAQEPTPSKAVAVAGQLTHRALLAMGLPPAEEASQLRAMVDGLLSTNETLKTEGAKALAARDKSLAEAQHNQQRLQAKLDDADRRLEKVNRQNAEWADKWARLARLVKWLVGGVVLLIVLGLALQIAPLFVPALAPTQAAFLRLVSAVQKIRGRRKDDEADAILRGELDERDRWVINKAKRRLGLV